MVTFSVFTSTWSTLMSVSLPSTFTAVLLALCNKKKTRGMPKRAIHRHPPDRLPVRIDFQLGPP